MKRRPWCVGLLLLCILAFAACSKDKIPDADSGKVTPTVEVTKEAEVTPTEGVTVTKLVVGTKGCKDWIQRMADAYNKAQQEYHVEVREQACFCKDERPHTSAAFLEAVCNDRYDAFAFTAEQYEGCLETLEKGHVSQQMVGMFVESVEDTKTIFRSRKNVVTLCKDSKNVGGVVAFLDYLEECRLAELPYTFTVATDACEEWVSEKAKAFNESQNELRNEVVAVELPETEYEVYLSTEYTQLMMEQKPDMYCFAAEHYNSCVETLFSMSSIPHLTMIFPWQEADYTTTYSSEEYVVMTSDFCEEPSYVAEFLEFLAE